jgi:hypothetical protein
MSMQKRYWFPAKRYGWGWGPPNCWQGWAVLGCWLAFLFAAMPRFSRGHSAAGGAFLIAMLGLLLVIFYFKGDPLRWRWGDRG